MLIKYNMRHRLIGLVLAALSFSSCKKTNEYAQEVNDTPYLITGEVDFQSIGKGYYNGFKRSYLFGDTMTIVGRFFFDKPGAQTRLGNLTIQPLEKYRLANGVNTYTQQTEYLDVMRFLITKEMGIGNHIPFTITGNGKTIQAPDISIQQFTASLHQTDTTLYVEQLANWVPDDLAYYQGNSLPLISHQSTTAEGDVYFGNYTVINALHAGKITRVVKVNDQFMENGSTFTIKSIASSVVTYDGRKLIFSTEVTEGSPEAAASYILRLCSMDLATRQVTTINRTLVAKEDALVNEKAGPFEGAIGSLKIAAMRLKTDAIGNIYFLNKYSPARTNHANSQRWYANGQWPEIYRIDPVFYNNICRMDAGGTVKSLFTQHDAWYGSSLFSIPGTPIQMTFDYVISPDGKALFCNNLASTNFAYSYASYDLEQDEIQYTTGFNQPSFRFFSYDTSATGVHQNTFDLFFYLGYSNYLSTFLYTADGDLLTLQTSSIAAVNLANKSMYCYAGTELGMQMPVDTQNQLTGPAKKVAFADFFWLTGIDKLGSVFYTGSLTDYTHGVNFYRMYSRK